MQNGGFGVTKEELNEDGVRTFLGFKEERRANREERKKMAALGDVLRIADRKFESGREGVLDWMSNLFLGNWEESGRAEIRMDQVLGGVRKGPGFGRGHYKREFKSSLNRCRGAGVVRMPVFELVKGASRLRRADAGRWCSGCLRRIRGAERVGGMLVHRLLSGERSKAFAYAELDIRAVCIYLTEPY